MTVQHSTTIVPASAVTVPNSAREAEALPAVNFAVAVVAVVAVVEWEGGVGAGPFTVSTLLPLAPPQLTEEHSVEHALMLDRTLAEAVNGWDADMGA